MEIFWLCEQCDSTNNYEETRVCSVCGEKITPGAEEKCIYEIAEELYATASTSVQLFNACEYYLKVINYKNARQKYSECHFKAEKYQLNEKIYDEASQHLIRAQEYSVAEKWTEAENEFTVAEERFEKIVGFMDSKEKIRLCQTEKDLCNSRRIYSSAKKVLAGATEIADYKKAAELFAQIIKFTDAKENYDICLKFIEKLTAKQQYEELVRLNGNAEKEADLDNKIVLLQAIVAFEGKTMTEEAKQIVLQNKGVLDGCLKEKKAIQTKRDFEAASEKFHSADKLTDQTERANAFSKILNDYQSYVSVVEFLNLFTRCREKVAEANNNVAYNKALEMMDRADSSTAFKKAEEAFSALGNYKDSEQKREECSERFTHFAKEDTYKMAMEAYNKAKRINIFNWKKYV